MLAAVNLGSLFCAVSGLVDLGANKSVILSAFADLGAGGIIPTPSGSAILAPPSDALSRRAVELRSHPLMNE
jgi:hypothetical protein